MLVLSISLVLVTFQLPSYTCQACTGRLASSHPSIWYKYFPPANSFPLFLLFLFVRRHDNNPCCSNIPEPPLTWMVRSMMSVKPFRASVVPQRELNCKYGFASTCAVLCPRLRFVCNGPVGCRVRCGERAGHTWRGRRVHLD